MSTSQINAIMLAAGTGSRLKIKNRDQVPKCLLKFGGKSLLQLHIETLMSNNITSLTIVAGYRAEDIITEIGNLKAKHFVDVIVNRDFKKGSIVSLWCARRLLYSESSVLFMDADVLYHPKIIESLTLPSNGSHLPYDKNFEPGNEPVKVCFKQSKLVEFGKEVKVSYDEIGEWPGFLRLSPESAQHLANDVKIRIERGKLQLACEVSIRNTLLRSVDNDIKFKDITGLPWIEIDFPSDVEKATSIILPQIQNYGTKTNTIS